MQKAKNLLQKSAARNLISMKQTPTFVSSLHLWHLTGSWPSFFSVFLLIIFLTISLLSKVPATKWFKLSSLYRKHNKERQCAVYNQKCESVSSTQFPVTKVFCWRRMKNVCSSSTSPKLTISLSCKKCAQAEDLKLFNGSRCFSVCRMVAISGAFWSIKCGKFTLKCEFKGRLFKAKGPANKIHISCKCQASFKGHGTTRRITQASVGNIVKSSNEQGSWMLEAELQPYLAVRL